MTTKISNIDSLRSKDGYNRISLQVTWAHARKNSLKFERLRLDYGDSRGGELSEKRKFQSEGLKI